MERTKKYRKINKNCKNIENPLIYVLKYGILPLDHSGNVRRTKNIYERNPQDMNKTELIEQVAKETEMTKKAAEAAVTAVFEAIEEILNACPVSVCESKIVTSIACADRCGQ